MDEIKPATIQHDLYAVSQNLIQALRPFTPQLFHGTADAGYI